MKKILPFLFFLFTGSILLAQDFELKPGQSLTEVRDAVRVWHAENPGKTATVRIAPGEYFLSEPVVFSPEDSFTCYEAQDPNKKPTFTRGIRISGWKVLPNGWFTTQIETVKNGTFWFESLFVNGKRAVPARSPNADVPDGRRYFYILEADQDEPLTKFTARDEQKALWAEAAQNASLNDVKIKFYHSWESSLHRVAAVDPAKNQVTLTGGPRWKLDYWGTNLRYHVEGLESALDQPGEFLLKRDGTCLYIPREGETPENVRIFAPAGPKTFPECGFLKFEGTPSAGETQNADEIQNAGKVREMTFRNLIFECDTWNLPPQGLSDGQSAVSSPISILADHAEALTFESCIVRNIGGYAFHFHQGCSACRVEKCLMEDLGAGGVRIGAGHGTDLSPQNLTSGVTVRNCIIRGYGRIDAGGIGIWIGHSPRNKVLHNEIFDGFYTGVSVGWVWGYRESAAVENQIEFNHIHHIGHGVLSDMGGVYCLGISPGTTVSNNVIHDVASYNRYGRGGWGLYTDEGSSNIVMENNLVYRTHTGNFHQHYGKENIVRNNIFAFSREEQLKRSRPETHLSFTLERNIILYDSSRGEHLLLGNWENPYSAVNRNVYWNFDTQKGVTFNEKPIEEWRKFGKDADSIIADPCFADAQGGDFRFTEASGPVLEKIGFQPFDFTRAGLLKDDPQWLAEAQNWSIPPLVLTPDGPEPPPLEVSDDFETPRRSPLLKVRAPFGKPGSYQILEENGNHFLRMTDTPDQKNAFDPFFSYWMTYTVNGIARLAFDVRMSEKAEMLVEVRDQGRHYRVAVPMRIRTDGFHCSGTSLDLEPNTWTRFELLVPVGPDRGENYTLKVTPKGKPAETFTLPIADPNWKTLNEFVFAALGHVDAVLDLDNIEIHFTK